MDDVGTVQTKQQSWVYSTARLQPGDRINTYVIQEFIAEGGFADVYIAKLEPDQNLVVIKVLKPGMDSRDVLARFRAEKQTLDLLCHDNIASSLDEGITDRGLPYFVMEYIRGIHITEHCDNARLTIEQRVDLLLQVCDGIRHAHEHKVIHRDLKPSNLLVSVEGAMPQVKIIDFGISRALVPAREECFTMHGQFIGTPAYASPEQIEMTMQDVDHRTDIFSLGVVAYELLVGVNPWNDNFTSDVGERRQRMRDFEPVLPSKRMLINDKVIQEAAKARQSTPQKLARKLSASLDQIIIHTLERDRMGRYQRAAHLLEDLERAQHGIAPVHAPSPAKGVPWRSARWRITAAAIVAVGTLTLSLLFPYFVETKPAVEGHSGDERTEITNPAEPTPVEGSKPGNNGEDSDSTDKDWKKENYPKPNERAWSERSEVRLIDHWGRDGNPEVSFTRPLRPAAHDWITLKFAADIIGYAYVFQLLPGDSLIYQVRVLGMPPDQCDPMPYEHAHEVQAFGTYKLDDPPGRYAFLILLTNRPLESVCVEVPKLWANTNRNDDFRDRFVEAIGRSRSYSDILGYDVFEYEVFDE